MIRVLLAEDLALVRVGVRALVESEPDMSICGEAATGVEAVMLARRLCPDVVMMDIRMPQLDGIEATRTLTADPNLPQVKVLILTTFETEQYVFEALRAGASGFLLKDGDPVDLLRAVRIVASGDALLAPSVTRRLIAEFASLPEAKLNPERLACLTDREREVMAIAAHGLSNDEIADRLTISTATAKTHVSRAMSKLEAPSRAQLVVIAYQTGLVAPGENLAEPDPAPVLPGTRETDAATVRLRHLQ